MAFEEEYLSYLPVEVMSVIIKHCDGVTIGNLAKTCKRWNEYIQTYRKFFTMKWGVVCRNEMNPDFLLDIMQNICPDYWLGKTVCWKLVFKCWKQSYYFSRWISSIDVLDKITTDHACAIRFSGEWILIATKTEGALEAVNYQSKEKVVLFRCDSILDLHVRCRPRQPESEQVLLKGLEHDEAVLVLLRSYIFFNLHTGMTTVMHKPNNFQTFKWFENIEVTVNDDITPATVCVVDTLAGESWVSLKENCIYPNVVQVWNGKILMLDYNDRNGGGIFHVMEYNLEKLDHPLSDHRINIYNYLLFEKKLHYHLGVCITLDGAEFLVNVDGAAKKYNMRYNLNCKALSCLYHAGLLLIGTDIGVIYGYRVKKDEDLLSLNVRLYDFRVDVCSEPLMAIDLKETSDRPIIAAATPLQIYVIRFGYDSRKDSYASSKMSPSVAD